MNPAPARSLLPHIAGLLLGIALLLPPAVSARPANDDFQDRILLTGLSLEFPVLLEGSSYEPGEPEIFRSRGSAWWSWIAPEDGMLAVWLPGRGDSRLTLLLGNELDTLRAPTSLLTWEYVSASILPVRAGDPVAIQIGESFVELLPQVNALLQFVPRPSNRTYATRAPLAGLPVRITGRLAGAAWLPPEQASDGIHGNLWWSWVAPESGPITIRIEAPPPNDADFPLGFLVPPAPPTIEVYAPPASGDLPGAPLYARSLPFDLHSLSSFADITIPAIAGHTYALRLHGWLPPSAEVSVQLVRGTVPELVLLSPTNRAVFNVGEPVTIAAAATKAPQGALPPAVEFELIDNTRGGSLRSERVLSPPHRITQSGLEPGTYEVRARALDAHGVAAESFPVTFTVLQRNLSPETAQVLSGSERAINGSVGSQPFCNTLAGVPQAGCDGWWSWTAPADGPYTLVVNPVGTTELGYALFLQQSLSPLNLAPVGTAFRSAIQTTPQNSISFLAAAGQTFQIMVQGLGGQAADFSLRILNSTGPTVTLTSPHDGADLAIGDLVTLEAEAAKPGTSIERVRYWMNGPGYPGYLGTATAPPYPVQLGTPIGFLFPGDHVLVAQAIAADGSTALSLPVTVHVYNKHPANDAIADRIPLQADAGWAEGTAFGATKEPGEPLSYASSGSAWWSFTPARSGPYTLVIQGSGLVQFYGQAPPDGWRIEANEVVGQPTPEAYIVFDGVAGAEKLISLAAMDDTPTASNHIALKIVSGSPPSLEFKAADYRYARVGDLITAEAVAADPDGPVTRVDFLLGGQLVQSLTSPPFKTTFPIPGPAGWDTRPFGAVAWDASGLHSPTSTFLSLPHLAALPPNDSFASRIPVEGLPAVVGGTGSGATFEPDGIDDPAFSSVFISGDVWYSWTAPRSTRVTVTLVPINPQGFTQTLRVWKGTALKELTLLGETNSYFPAGTGASVTVPAIAGENYAIQVLEADRFTVRIWERSSWGIHLQVTDGPPGPEGIAQVTLEALADVDPAAVRSVSLIGGRRPVVLTSPPYRTTIQLGTDLTGIFSSTVTDVDGGLWESAPVVVPLLDKLPHAANDSFEEAAPLRGYAPRVITPPLNLVTLQAGEVTAVDELGSAWWSWVAPESGTVTLTHTFYSAATVYTGNSLADLIPVPVAHGAGQPSHEPQGDHFAFQATAGETYLIRFGTRNQWLSGLEFTLCLTPDRILWPRYEPGRGFGFDIASPAAGRWRVEVSSDLEHWAPLGDPATSAGFLEVQDPDAPAASQRFYRAVPLE